DETGLSYSGFRSGSRGRFLIYLFNPFELHVAASLVQNLPGVVVYVNPGVRPFIAICHISCLFDSFAVFPERSTWPCESVDGIESYDPKLTFRGLSLHCPPRAADSFRYPNACTKASIKVPGRSLSALSGPKYFLTFCSVDVF